MSQFVDKLINGISPKLGKHRNSKHKHDDISLNITRRTKICMSAIRIYISVSHLIDILEIWASTYNVFVFFQR